MQKGNIDSLQKAKSLCKIATVTSNLDSEDTDIQTSDDEHLLPSRNPVKSNNPVVNETLQAPIIPIIPALSDIASESSTSSSQTLMSTENYIALSSSIASLEFTTQEIHKKINQIEVLLKFLIERDTSPNNVHLQDRMGGICSKLPLKTKEDVEDLEKVLEEADKNKTLEEILFLTGGETFHKNVYNIMKKLLSPEATALYSGLGRKNKMPFCTLKIYEVIVAAVRRRFPEVADTNIRKSVSLFLATAKDRLKN